MFVIVFIPFVHIFVYLLHFFLYENSKLISSAKSIAVCENWSLCVVKGYISMFYSYLVLNLKRLSRKSPIKDRFAYLAAFNSNMHIMHLF